MEEALAFLRRHLAVGSDLRLVVALVGLSWLLPAAFASAAEGAPAWLAPGMLSGDGQNATSPRVAVDTHGDAIAVWLFKSDGSNNVVQAATHTPGAAWSAPVDLSVLGKDAESPQVAMNGAGDAAVVWVRSDGSNNIVQVVTRAAGGSWSSPLDLSDGGENADSPRVALDASGDVFAAWDRNDGMNDRLQAAVETGETWSATTTISATGVSANLYSLSVNPGGSALVAWDQYDTMGNYVVEVARYASGVWGSPQALSSATGDGAEPSAALTSSGAATIAWSERVADGNFVIDASSQPSGGSWSSPLTLSAENANGPLVEADDAGNTTVAWDQLAGDTYSVQAETDGGPTQTLATASNPANISRISAGVDSSGNVALAMYRYVTASDADLEVVYERAGTNLWTSPSTVATFASTGFSRSDLAVDPDGNGTAVWESEDSGLSVIHAAISTNTVITSQPPANTNQTTASFGFASSEASATFECKLDAGSFTPCTSPQAYDGVSNGSHTFEVYAADANDIADPAGPVAASWKVNTIPPTVAIAEPQDGAWVNTSRPTLAGTGTAVNGADPSVTVDIYVGAAATGSPQKVPATLSGGAWSITAPQLPDGTYTAVAEQGDNAGNTGHSSPVTFGVDTAAPTPTLTDPVDGSTTNTSTPGLGGGAGTAAGDTPSLTVYIYSGETAQGPLVQSFTTPATGSTWSTQDPQPLANGVYSARATQTDRAGNVGYTTVHTFTVNAPPPTPSSGGTSDGSIGQTSGGLSGGTPGTTEGQTGRGGSETITVGKAAAAGTAVHFSVICALANASPCSVLAELTVTELIHGTVAGAPGRARTKLGRKVLVIGTTKITLAAGTGQAIKVSLNRAGKRLLAKAGSLRATLVVKLSKRVVARSVVSFERRARRP